MLITYISGIRGQAQNQYNCQYIANYNLQHQHLRFYFLHTRILSQDTITEKIQSHEINCSENIACAVIKK